MLDDGQNYAYSQAFYYGIFSAGLYFLVASLMAVTVYGAWAGHYDAEFKLTMSQRTLMLQTISFLVYLLGGSAVFAHIEGWNYLDAVYWTDYTLLTVGIGDFAPATHLGRSLLFPFAIGGIIILGLVIGSIRSLVLERGKVKMEARMVEKERQRILKRFERKGKTGLLEPVRPNTEDSSSGFSVKPGEDLEAAERRRRQEEFQLMRKIQARAADRRRWLALSISATTWFVLWFAGAAVFWAAEDEPQGWTYFVALYFSYTSHRYDWPRWAVRSLGRLKQHDQGWPSSNRNGFWSDSCGNMEVSQILSGGSRYATARPRKLNACTAPCIAEDTGGCHAGNDAAYLPRIIVSVSSLCHTMTC